MIFEKKEKRGQKRNLLILQVSRELSSGSFWLRFGRHNHPRASGTQAGLLAVKPPKEPCAHSEFLGSNHIVVHLLHQFGFCSGPLPRNFGGERGDCREQSELAGPSPGQETQPCCGVHRNKKESLLWHRAESH